VTLQSATDIDCHHSAEQEASNQLYQDTTLQGRRSWFAHGIPERDGTEKVYLPTATLRKQCHARVPVQPPWLHSMSKVTALNPREQLCKRANAQDPHLNVVRMHEVDRQEPFRDSSARRAGSQAERRRDFGQSGKAYSCGPRLVASREERRHRQRVSVCAAVGVKLVA
jgi:hypothetical protein